MNASSQTHTDLEEFRNLLTSSALPSAANLSVLISVKQDVRQKHQDSTSKLGATQWESATLTLCLRMGILSPCFSWLLLSVSGVPKQGEHWPCIQMYQVQCLCAGMLMNAGIRRLAREELCKKSLFFQKVLLCPMAEGQSLVHAQRVADFLITVPETLCPTI